MQPVIKWAGGKRQLLPELKKMVPEKYNTYVEPFFGGGALFFELSPEKAIINDINTELINLYETIKYCCDDFAAELALVQDKYNSLETEEQKLNFYYRRRNDFNSGIINPEKLGFDDAVLLVFLNKTCFNGLYRTNSQGLFNVPFGRRANVSLFDAANLAACSEQLKKAQILNTDFAEACKDLKEGDFVFFDSPYYGTYDMYKAGGFPVDEHLRLNALFNELTEKGVKCLLTNSDTDFIKELYSSYTIKVVDVRRNINRDGGARSGKEVIVTNY